MKLKNRDGQLKDMDVNEILKEENYNLTQHSLLMEQEKRESINDYKRLESDFYNQKQDILGLKAEIGTLQKIYTFATNMFEPLHYNEMIACSIDIEELEDEFIKAPRIDL